MDLFEALSYGYIIVFVIIVAFSRKIRLKKYQIRFMLFLLSLSLAVIAYNVNPPQNWDIVRHSAWMDDIRASGMSFFEFVFNNKSGVGYKEYSTLYVFNILRYFSISISKNNYFLSAMCVFINYMIESWIIVDWEEISKSNKPLNMITLLTLGAFVTLGGMTSNIRYPLASSLTVLAIYLYLCKKKPVAVYIILMGLALSVHPGVIVTIPIVLLSTFSFNKIIVEYCAVFIITVLSDWISHFLLNRSSQYLQIIGARYISYTSEGQYRSSRYGFYGSILVFVIIIICYLLQRKSIISSDKLTAGQKKLYEFLCLYMVYCLANGNSYVLLTRIASTIGRFAPVMKSIVSDDRGWEHVQISHNNITLIRIGCFTCFIILVVYMNVKSKIEYMPYMI